MSRKHIFATPQMWRGKNNHHHQQAIKSIAYSGVDGFGKQASAVPSEGAWPPTKVTISPAPTHKHDLFLSPVLSPG